MYLKLFISGLKENLHFKVDFTFSIFEKIIRITILYYFFKAVLNSPLEFKSVITYIFLAILVETIVQSELLDLMSQKIETGEAAYWSTRPKSFVYVLFSFCFGKNSINIIICTLIIIFISIRYNYYSQVNLFFLSLFLACFISFYIQLLLGFIVFYTINSWGVQMLHNALFLIFSGVMFPVNLLPDGFQNVFYYLPFYSTVAVPVRVFMGTAGINEILMQIFWMVLLFISSKLIFLKIKNQMLSIGG